MNINKYFTNCVFSIFLLVLAGCSDLLTGSTVIEIPSEDGSYTAYFCKLTDCSEVFVNNINLASESVDCAFYNLKLENIINSLALKSREVPVRIVLEGENYKDHIKGENIRLAKRNGLGIMHDKFCVVDNAKVITGSYNPSKDSSKYDNNVVVINSNLIALNYEDEFEELWDNEVGGGGAVEYPVVNINGKRVENYFCPEDGCIAKVVDLIKNAKESIYFMTYSFTSEEIADAILFSELDIKGVFEKQQASSKYSQFKRLKDFGVDVKLDSNKYLMHHKVFIIDEEIVVTGSMNPTESGDERNDENILIIYDSKLALKYLEEFQRVFG